jgi:hypothetical protein
VRAAKRLIIGTSGAISTARSPPGAAQSARFRSAEFEVALMHLRPGGK